MARRRTRQRTKLRRSTALAGALALLSHGAANAADALVAVATNFAEVMQRLEAQFEAATSHTLTVTAGSTGKLYAQIVAGAPFDALLAADQVRPARLESEGFAVPGSRFTYATGAIALWSPDPDRIGIDGAAILRADNFRRLAIANPALAPYGLAARQALQAMGVYDTVRERLVIGENIGQAHAMVASGNAELGMVALAYVLSPRNKAPGSRWDVPVSLYDPIRQDAVLLMRARNNAAAAELLEFLRTASARATIRAFGYGAD
mgnify:CR=1 FL=1